MSTWSSTHVPSRQVHAFVACDKGGDHSGERITLICTNALCRHDSLCCGVCFSRKHSSHEVIEIDSLLDDLEEKWKNVQRKCELNIDSELEGSRVVCSEAITSLQQYVETKLSKLNSKMISHLADARTRNQREWAAASQSIKQIRSINDNKILQSQLLDILDQSTIANGRITSFNPEILPNKGKVGDSVNSFTQSFILTLKNIHAIVAQQYAKMCDPLAQPHHLKKDFFVASSVSSSTSSQKSGSSNYRHQHVNGSQTSSNAPSQFQSQQYSEQDAPDTPINYNNDNFDTLSFSSKRNNNNNKINNNNNHHVQPSHTTSITGSNQSSQANLLLAYNNAIKDKQSRMNSPIPFDTSSQASGFGGLATLQQSTVSQNLTQLQQSQATLYQQIHQQSILLEQLAKQTSQSHAQLQTSYLPNAFGFASPVAPPATIQPNFIQQDNPPVFGSPAASTVVSEYKKSWVGSAVSQQQQSQAKPQDQSDTSSLMGSTSPPQRLLYYSSIFSQHLQGKSSSTQLNNQFSSSSQQQINSSRKNSPNTSTTGNQHSRKGGNSSNSSMITGKSVHDLRRPFTTELEDAEQDLVESDFATSSKIKELPKSSERQFRYRFHKDFKHEFLSILDQQRSVRGSSDNNETRLALLAPSVETKPLQECYWTFKILSCKSVAYSSPLAVGLCLKKHVELSSFKFIGEDTAPADGGILQQHRSQSSFSRLHNKVPVGGEYLSSHGCYLLTSAGFVRNHTDQSQDMKRVPVRFDQGDTLHCHFNPFRKYLKIKNQTTGQFCMINIQMRAGDALYPCVRISYCQDQVQVIDSQGE